MVKAVIWDIDGTMYDYETANRKAMQKVYIYMEETLHLGPEQAKDVLTQAIKLVEARTGTDCAASHNRLIRFECMLELLHNTEHYHALHLYHLYWDTLLEVMEPEPGLSALVSALLDAGISMGVGSDMTAYIQYKKLQKLNMLDKISRITTSEEAGAEKPDPKMFSICAEKMGCRPEECVWIGDSLKKDVQGAAAAGMQALWYRPGVNADSLASFPQVASYYDCLTDDFIVLGKEKIPRK